MIKLEKERIQRRLVNDVLSLNVHMRDFKENPLFDYIIYTIRHLLKKVAKKCLQ